MASRPLRATITLVTTVYVPVPTGAPLARSPRTDMHRMHVPQAMNMFKHCKAPSISHITTGRAKNIGWVACGRTHDRTACPMPSLDKLFLQFCEADLHPDHCALRDPTVLQLLVQCSLQSRSDGNTSNTAVNIAAPSRLQRSGLQPCIQHETCWSFSNGMFDSALGPQSRNFCWPKFSSITLQ